MLEMLVYVLVSLLLLALAIKGLAKEDVSFTEGLSNYVKYVERAGVFDHMIPEVPGYVVDNPYSRDATIREARPGETQPMSRLNTILQRRLGIYFYGPYPFKKMARVRIKKEWDNLKGTGPSDWITTGPEVDEPGIRHTFPRAFVFTNVELSDRTKVNLKVVLKLRVVKPYIPKYIFRNDFFTQTGSIIQSEVIDNLIDITVDDGQGGRRKLTIDDFINLKKGEVAGFLKVHKDDLPSGEPSLLNQALISQVGLCIDGINVNDWDPADEDTIKAIRQKALERLQGEARVTKAEKDRETELINADRDAQALLLRTTAEVTSQNQLTDARGKRIRETVASLASSLGDPNVVATGASSVLEMEAATSATSKLTTLVKDRSSVVVPVGGDK